MDERISRGTQAAANPPTAGQTERLRGSELEDWRKGRKVDSQRERSRRTKVTAREGGCEREISVLLDVSRSEEKS